MSGKFEEEMAKAAGQITIETVKDIRGVFSKIFGEALTELGKSFGDRVRLWRLKNLIQMSKEVERLCRDQHVSIEALKELSLGDAVRIIDAASFEDDEDVQKLWAQLIVNSANPTDQTTVKKFYIDLLRSLGGAEVALLDLLWVCEANCTFRTPKEVQAFNEKMNEHAEQRWRKYSADVRGAAIQNMARLRCLTFRPRPVNASNLLARLPKELQGGIGAEWSAIDPKRFQTLVQQLGDLIVAATGAAEYQQSEQIPVYGGLYFYGAAISVVEMNYVLTSLGKDLMRACTSKS